MWDSPGLVRRRPPRRDPAVSSTEAKPAAHDPHDLAMVPVSAQDLTEPLPVISLRLTERTDCQPAFRNSGEAIGWSPGRAGNARSRLRPAAAPMSTEGKYWIWPTAPALARIP
jgi:hypothetical protein